MSSLVCTGAAVGFVTNRNMKTLVFVRHSFQGGLLDKAINTARGRVGKFSREFPIVDSATTTRCDEKVIAVSMPLYYHAGRFVGVEKLSFAKDFYCRHHLPSSSS